MCNRNIVTLLVFVCAYQARGLIDNGNFTETITEKNVPNNTERTERALHKECHSTIFSAKCIKIHLLSFLEDLSSRDELSLLPGLSIVRENTTTSVLSPEEMAAELSRQFPGKPEEKLNQYLLYRLKSYLDGHSLRYKLLDEETAKEAMESAKGESSVARKGGGGGGGLTGLGATGFGATGGGGGGGKGGKGGGGSGLLTAALLIKGALAAAALAALGVLAGKALMAALLSLALSAIVGLKGHGGHKSTTYEIITKPEISHHHSQSHEEHHEHDHGHHGGYRRVYDMGYNSYMPYTAPSST